MSTNPTNSINTPAQELPDEVREAIMAGICGYENLFGSLVRSGHRLHEVICAALAPLWPRPAPRIGQLSRENGALRAEVERLTKDGRAHAEIAEDKGRQVRDLRAQLAACEARHTDAQAAIRSGLKREDALKAQLAAAKADKERLDWLAREVASGRGSIEFGLSEDGAIAVSAGTTHAAGDLRAAIDAARREVTKRTTKRPALSGCWLGSLRFAPGQHENHVRIALVDTCAELQAHVARWHGKRVAKDMVACCCWDFDSQGPDHGWIIFAREKLTRAVVVHEVVHAGLLFVSQHVMTSGAVQKMPEIKQGDYYDEACAQVVEKLYTQAEALLWPDAARREGGAK